MGGLKQLPRFRPRPAWVLARLPIDKGRGLGYNKAVGGRVGGGQTSSCYSVRVVRPAALAQFYQKPARLSTAIRLLSAGGFFSCPCDRLTPPWTATGTGAAQVGPRAGKVGPRRSRRRGSATVNHIVSRQRASAPAGPPPPSQGTARGAFRAGGDIESGRRTAPPAVERRLPPPFQGVLRTVVYSTASVSAYASAPSNTMYPPTVPHMGPPA